MAGKGREIHEYKCCSQESTKLFLNPIVSKTFLGQLKLSASVVGAEDGKDEDRQ